MEHLAWSNGDKPERSYKENRPIDSSSKLSHDTCVVSDCGIRNEIVEASHNKKLHDTPTILEPDPGDYALTRDTFRKTSSRRETSNAKLSERHMVSRACGNPFLTHLNYTDDILTQEQFLIPKNSNMESENDIN